MTPFERLWEDPIANLEETRDLLGHSEFTELLARQLRDSSPISLVAYWAPWGAGKSRICALLLETARKAET